MCLATTERKRGGEIKREREREKERERERMYHESANDMCYLILLW